MDTLNLLSMLTPIITSMGVMAFFYFICRRLRNEIAFELRKVANQINSIAHYEDDESCSRDELIFRLLTGKDLSQAIAEKKQQY